MPRRDRNKIMDVELVRRVIEAHEAGLSLHAAGRIVGKSATTVLRWVNRKKELNLAIEQIRAMGDDELKEAFFKQKGPKPSDRYQPDLEVACQDVAKGMTIKKCFENYQKKAAEAFERGETTLKPIGRARFHDKLGKRLKELEKKKRRAPIGNGG